MSSRPLQEGYFSVPPPGSSLVSKGYGSPSGTRTSDVAPAVGKPDETFPLAQSFPRSNNMYSAKGEDADEYGPTMQQPEGPALHRTASQGSSKGGRSLSRSNTLKKQKSLSRKTSLKRNGSRKSLAAGSIRGVSRGNEEYNSIFHTPIPTTGTPTEILANRFQAWRKFLKDLIAYFREIQSSYETRGKALLKVSNIINNLNAPSMLMTEGGLNEANRILRDYHKQSVAESNKARDIENDVINQLTGLRTDLGLKIKEIKSLSSDFKNSVDKEKDHTRKAVNGLQEALAVVDSNPRAIAGKDDPFLIRLNVERQVEKQVDEENYLHRAYLNLEGSGRELESIVVGEIQKAYNTYAGIVKREADAAHEVTDHLRSGPITLAKDFEWNQFVENDPHFVNPDTPVREVGDITYPGKNHPAAAEVRAGMLERKSKYLKSYAPGWYVLSPTHLHEFKSAERIYTQPPMMSLLLADQKLGSKSQPGSSSHKFILKGRQAGGVHRGHSWVFRAESYETMLAWYDDIEALTEKTGEERNAFVRKHARSFSSNSLSRTGSDSGMEEDEADEVPFSANASMISKQIETPPLSARPQPGGRFPSDLQVSRHLQAPLSPSSGSSVEDQELSTAVTGLQEGAGYHDGHQTSDRAGASSGLTKLQQYAPAQPSLARQEYFPRQSAASTLPPAMAYQQKDPTSMNQPNQARFAPALAASTQFLNPRHESNYKSWIAPSVGGAALGAGAVGTEEHWRNQRKEAEAQKRQRDLDPLADDSEKSTAMVSSPSTFTDSTAPTSLEGENNAIIPIAPLQKIAATSSPVVGEGSIPGAAPAALALEPIAGGLLTVEPQSIDVLPTGSTSHTKYDTSPDGTVNAHPTGRMFPAVLRHNTDVSISDLHIPGEYTY